MTQELESTLNDIKNDIESYAAMFCYWTKVSSKKHGHFVKEAMDKRQELIRAKILDLIEDKS